MDLRPDDRLVRPPPASVPYWSRRSKTRIKTYVVLLAVILAVLGVLLGAKSLGLAGGSGKAACWTFYSTTGPNNNDNFAQLVAGLHKAADQAVSQPLKSEYRR